MRIETYFVKECTLLVCLEKKLSFCVVAKKLRVVGFVVCVYVCVHVVFLCVYVVFLELSGL